MTTFHQYYDTLGMTDSEVVEFEQELEAASMRWDDEVNLMLDEVAGKVAEETFFHANYHTLMTLEHCL
jgi:hypothetical protein